MSFILFIQVPLDEPLALLLPTWLLNLQKVPLWHKTWHLALLSQLFFVQYTQSVMRHQTGDGWFVMDRKMSVIKRCPTHLYECLWWHYFKTRNIVTTFACLFTLFAGHCDPSQTIITFDTVLQIGCIGHVYYPKTQEVDLWMWWVWYMNEYSTEEYKLLIKKNNQW